MLRYKGDIYVILARVQGTSQEWEVPEDGGGLAWNADS